MLIVKKIKTNKIANFLEPKYLETYKNCINFLSKRFKIEELNKNAFEQLSILTSQLKILKDTKNLELFDAKIIQQYPFQYTHCFISYDLQIVQGGKSGVFRDTIKEPYQFSFIELNRFFGHVIIRPENLSDKVIELFKRKEIDFKEHKQFSNNYYFLAENEETARSSVNWKFLDTINSYDQLIVEIINNRLFLTKSCILNVDITKELSEISFQIQESLS